MPLLALSHVSFRYGAENVLEDVTVAIEKGRKIGVIGQNGTGKSTLLRLLAGRLEPTDGQLTRQRGARSAIQEQELRYGAGATVREEMRRVREGDVRRAERLAEIEESLAAAEGDEQRRLLTEYERLQREHEAADGYDVERRIEAVLSSLGLPDTAWDQPVERFSGGERNIIGLAGVLLSDPDVMLLDEPSNHLDTWGIEWFCEFVRTAPAAVVMVSHNRYVLDRCVDEIWEVRRSGVVAWPGNYSAFREEKARVLDLQERRWKAQEKEVARLEFQARRQMDMANAYDDPAQARRAKNMLRRAERLRKVDRPDRAEDRFRAKLGGGARHGAIALDVQGLTVRFGERTILDDADLALEYGDRVCLVGPNGSGKTTLYRHILEHGSWENERVRVGKAVRLGEYSQLHDVLDHGETLLDWAAGVTRLANPEASALLHRFLFTREDLDRPIATLSGGEKSRLQLARLVHLEVNLLLLDEPTNHLDIQACEQLEAMLAKYDGTLLVISHDRYFLDGLVNRVVELRDRKLHLFHGSFSEWWEEKQRRGEDVRRGALELRSRKDAESTEKAAARRDREERKARQRELRRLERELRRIESKLDRLTARREALTAALQEAYAPGADPTVARDLTSELEAVQHDIIDLETRWDEAATALEGPDA